MRGKKVVAIGVFDGMHLGHRKILKEAAGIAGRVGAHAVALTFNPHPLSVISPKNAPLSLMSLKHRLRLIRAMGITRCVILNFTKRFANISPESFVKDILAKRLNAGWVVVGEDFCFGRDRSGDTDFLEKKGSQYGFVVKRIKKIKYKGFSVSSSLIRRSVQKGRLAFARKLLGRPAAVLGTVVKGNRLGEKIGFPTANINPHHEVIPPSGVYAVRVNIGRQAYGGVVNIGKRPTFYGPDKQDEEPRIEVHIFDFSKKIYQKDVEIEFIKRIRSEKRFSDSHALARQIKMDVKKGKSYLIKFKEAACNIG